MVVAGCRRSGRSGRFRGPLPALQVLVQVEAKRCRGRRRHVRNGPDDDVQALAANHAGLVPAPGTVLPAT